MRRADPVFHAVIDSTGKPHITALAAWRVLLRRYRGMSVELVVRPQRVRRSRQANAYWWAVVIPTIADDLGYPPAEQAAVHDAVVRALRGTVGDEKLPVRPSTATMDRDDFAALVDEAIVWAATTLGVVIPDPDRAEARVS